MSHMPFEDPAVSSSVEWSQLAGSLLLFDVLGLEDNIVTSVSVAGEKTPAVRVNLSVVDGPQQGTRWEDVLVFPKMLQSALRPKVGKMVLGRLHQGEQTAAGKTPPWKLDSANEQDKQKAATLLAGNAAAPTYGSGTNPPMPTPTPQAPAQQQLPAEPPF